MARVVDSGNPNLWHFQGDNPFTWNDIGAEIIYTDDLVLGGSHVDGTGGKINLVLEDIYNRLGYVKRLGTAAGNRGYSKNVVINTTRALSIADSGLIRVATVPVGTSPTSAVELTLPTRAELVADGIGYFERLSIAPFLDVKGAGLAPFMIEGYETSTGVPLKINVANPTSPGSPVSGDDLAQSIVIGRFSATAIYLYNGEYAEFIPVIQKDLATGFWYLTWTVRVHNTGYQKFFKGGNGSVVGVGSSGYPSTNFEYKGNYYDFAIITAAALSYLPDNASGGIYGTINENKSSLLYIKVNTSTSGGAWTLTHNGGSAPAKYKKIITPSGADMAMKDGDILVLLEEQSEWRVVSILGTNANFSSVYAAITAETNGRTAADAILAGLITTANTNISTVASNLATEVTNRTTGDATLQTAIDLINQTLTKVVSINDWNMDAGATRTVAHGVSDHTKIRSVEVMIRKDAPSTDLIPLVTGLTGQIEGWVASVDATNINLARTPSGAFDNSNFDDVSYNRGFVVIHYVP